MMSAKIATAGLLKIAVFQNKCYDVIIRVVKFYHVIQFIL